MSSSEQQKPPTDSAQSPEAAAPPKKKIEDLKFYPDNPTDMTHKAHFSA